MDLKKIIASFAVKEEAGKLLPMDSDVPKTGWKAKVVAVLGVIITVATIAQQLLGG